MRIFSELFFFGVAGACGFIVDTAVLYLLRDAMGPFYARVVSFAAAVFATWLINRLFTFKARRSSYSKKHEFALYFLLMLSGGLVNYATYSWLVVNYTVVQQHLVLGVAAGSVAGMVVNFAVSRFLLFRHSA